MIALALFLVALAGPAAADAVFAARTMPAGTIISAGDLRTENTTIDGVLAQPSDAVGLQTVVTIYSGRPVRLSDLAAAKIVQRNQIITLVYSNGGLSIVTEGRALEDGGIGDQVRVMNISSRTTVSARIDPNGMARVN